LFGIEIMDEGDKVEDMQELAKQVWRKRALRMGIKLADARTPGTRDT
jgi:hypothetical protein